MNFNMAGAYPYPLTGLGCSLRFELEVCRFQGRRRSNFLIVFVWRTTIPMWPNQPEINSWIEQTTFSFCYQTVESSISICELITIHNIDINIFFSYRICGKMARIVYSCVSDELHVGRTLNCRQKKLFRRAQLEDIGRFSASSKCTGQKTYSNSPNENDCTNRQTADKPAWNIHETFMMRIRKWVANSLAMGNSPWESCLFAIPKIRRDARLFRFLCGTQ